MSRMLALLVALGWLVSAAARGAGLSGQADHHRGAGGARRRHRRARPHAGAALHRGLGPAGDRREPARRQQPDRRRVRHQGGARRLHADDRAGDDVRGQSEPLCQAAVRPGEGLHADRRPRHHQPRAHCASFSARQERQGPDRARQAEAGRDQLRHVRRRLERPPQHGAVPGAVRRQAPGRALQGRDAGAHRRRSPAISR